MTAKVPTSETGMARIGMIADASPAGRRHDQHHEHDRLVDGLHQFVDAVGDEARRVVADFVLDALREILAEVGHGSWIVLGRQRVRAGPLGRPAPTAGLSACR